jgi:hypothetical protein
LDELNDARSKRPLPRSIIAGVMRALLARHDEKGEAELYPLAQAR